MNKSASSPAHGGHHGDDHGGDLGDAHIAKHLKAAKDRIKSGRTRLEEDMTESRSNWFTGTRLPPVGGPVATKWLSDSRRKSKAVVFDPEQPKYVGQSANELSKYLNAESISRRKEEQNLSVPTLRQVLRVDDNIDVKQMTKSQLAMCDDPTDKKNKMRFDPNAKQRHVCSYRPLMKG